MPEKCLACGSRNTGISVAHEEARKISSDIDVTNRDKRVKVRQPPKWKKKIKKAHYCYDCGSYFTDDSHSSSGTIGTGI